MFRPRLPLLAVTALLLAGPDARGETMLVFRDLPDREEVRFEPDERERRVPAEFRLEAAEFEASVKELSTVGSVRSYEVRFPSPFESDVEANNTVHGRYFQPAGAGPFPACVLLHELDGHLWMVHTIADMLARRGVATLAIQMPYYADRRDEESTRRMVSFNAGHTVEAVKQVVLDTRRSLAWLASRAEVAKDRIGLAGVSLGGFVAAIAGAVEPRFSNVAIVLAGGNVADMIWNHKDRLADHFRRRWTAAGGSHRSLQAILRPFDPVTHAPLLKNRRVLMIAAKEDEIIPKSATLSLFQALDERPEIVWLDSGHITAFFYLRQEVDRLSRFLSGEAD